MSPAPPIGEGELISVHLFMRALGLARSAKALFNSSVNMNRRGTEPSAQWCKRTGVVKLPSTLSSPRATYLIWQGFTNFTPLLISDYPRRIFSELPKTLCTYPHLEQPKSMIREYRTIKN